MRKIYTLLLLLTMMSIWGCERRPIEVREENVAEVFVELDWSRSSLNPAEATVIFYDENGNSARTFYIIGNKGVVKLPVGTYSVLAFNDKMDDFSQLAFRGIDHYKTIEVYAAGMPKADYGKTNNQTTEDAQELLASDSRDTFEVTQAMLDQTKSSRSEGKTISWTRDQAHLVMFPTDVVAKAQIIIHVENMYLIRSGSQRGTINGFAEAVTLCNRQNSGTPMTHTIPFSYAEYNPGSKTDGFMSEQFIAFGLCTPKARTQPITFLFEAILRDKEQTKFSYHKDVTGLVEIKTEVGLGLKINIEIGADAGKGNPPIPIPPVIPIDDGAFDPGVSEWDEEEIINPFQ